jgi:hypothetical protein
MPVPLSEPHKIALTVGRAWPFPTLRAGRQPALSRFILRASLALFVID